MTQYDEVGLFGGLPFVLGDISVSEKQGTLKTNIGKSFIETEIVFRNNKNKVLIISGLLDGRTRTAGQTISDVVDTERETLQSLEDGYFHAYSDGKHSFNAVIANGSLRFEDSASEKQGQSKQFTMTLIEW